MKFEDTTYISPSTRSKWTKYPPNKSKDTVGKKITKMEPFLKKHSPKSEEDAIKDFGVMGAMPVQMWQIALISVKLDEIIHWINNYEKN